MVTTNEQVAKALTAALARVLRPLVRILIRYGIDYRAFTGVAKQVYVGVAAEEFRISERKQSVSRVAVLTGLPRKDVARMLEIEGTPADVAREEQSRIARILSGWRHDRRYLNAQGRPVMLPFDGTGATFSRLVRHYGADVPARAALDELLRMKAVTRLEDGRVRLAAESFLPAKRELDKFAILGADVADLVSAIDHNLVVKPAGRFLQRKVTYDNVPAEAASKLSGIATEQGGKLVEQLDTVFARHDRDVNPSVKGSDRKRVVLGVWFFAEDYASEADDRKPPEEPSE